MIRLSRFERRIVIAISLSALTPFLISIVFIPLIIESRLALAMHPQVQEQLEASAVFYKEFFDAKKKEYAARAESLARDTVLLAASRGGEVEDTRARLRQFVEDEPDIRRARILRADGELLAVVDGPRERQGDDYVPKTLALPLGLGEAPRLEIVFILPRRYLVDRERAEEIATLYAASLRTEEARSSEFYRGYLLIAAVFMLVSVSIGTFLARGVTRRIAQLASATERVARGESGFTIPLRGADEITELSDRFNRMIEEVASARDRIVYLEKVSGWQEFARRLAHEIKNPLTPIRLAIQELRQRAPDDGRYRRLVEDASDVVEEEIAALTRLVDEFSQFARLPEVSPSPVEMRRFLESFLAAYNHFEPDAEVTLEVPEQPVRAAIDRVLLRRVLANLVENGIQAAGPGEAKLWIRCAIVPVSGAVELRIEDNGPGVPSGVGEKIFEPYFTTKSEGTGLGLAIVKKIVLQHEGSIALRRSPVGGAAFIILLPPLAADVPTEEESGELDEVHPPSALAARRPDQ